MAATAKGLPTYEKSTAQRRQAQDRLLAANPHLAARGSVYPAGVLIILPEVAEPVAVGQIRLWGRT
ncbi:tail protein X [Cereibacter sphaeroides]|uniref:tail protein X n=1 Tax=Cereibacter sphaeroides TaxID=1063 RepID=UPI002E258D4D